MFLLLETPFVVVPTWGTVVLEFLLFAALLAPKKYWKWFLIPGLAFHLTIAVVIGLYSFATVMFAALILFLRPFEREFQIQPLLKLFKAAPRIPHRLRKPAMKGGEIKGESG